MERWESKWYPVGSKCTGLERTTSQTNISLAQAQGAFYILGIGLIMASLCLVTEKLFKLRPKTAPKKNTESTRVTYVGTMARRVSNINGGQTVAHNPAFTSPLEIAYGNIYTHGESSTDNGTSADFEENAKTKKKSNSCPLLFGCCVEEEKEEFSTQNGIATGSLGLRSAFSDTLWANHQNVNQAKETGSHSNGLVKRNGGSHFKQYTHAGFTFESIRDSQQSIHNAKDAETGEVSVDGTVFNIRL